MIFQFKQQRLYLVLRCFACAVTAFDNVQYVRMGIHSAIFFNNSVPECNYSASYCSRVDEGGGGDGRNYEKSTNHLHIALEITTANKPNSILYAGCLPTSDVGFRLSVLGQDQSEISVLVLPVL